jgi:hypothetical protein
MYEQNESGELIMRKSLFLTAMICLILVFSSHSKSFDFTLNPTISVSQVQNIGQAIIPETGVYLFSQGSTLSQVHKLIPGLSGQESRLHCSIRAIHSELKQLEQVYSSQKSSILQRTYYHFFGNSAKDLPDLS